MNSLGRREFLKTAVVGLGVLGASGLYHGKLGWAEKLYNLGDITISWAGVQLFYLPCEVAREKGFFEQEGLTVGKFFTSSGGSSTVRNIIDGGLPMGECSADSAASAIVKLQEPYKLVAGGIRTTGSILWLVRPDSNIKKIQDLKGKTASFTRAGSVTQAVLSLCLEAAPGINPSDVKKIAAGGVGAGLTLLDKGEIDAAMCSYPTMLTKGKKFRILFYARDLMPDYFQSFWIAQDSFLKKHPEQMRGFLRARARGVKYIQEHPKEAAKILAKTNVAINTVEGALETMKHEGVLDNNCFSDNRFVKQGLINVTKGMRVVGLLGPKQDIPWAKIIDQSYIAPEKRIKL